MHQNRIDQPSSARASGLVGSAPNTWFSCFDGLLQVFLCNGITTHITSQLTVLNNHLCALYVVYFDQLLGAVQYKCGSKYVFSMFFCNITGLSHEVIADYHFLYGFKPLCTNLSQEGIVDNHLGSNIG